MFEESARGVLLMPVEKVQNLITERVGNEDLTVLDKAEDMGIIHKTLRNFPNTRTLTFVSLRIEVLSRQCLTWVLTSLQRDQMTPIEIAVKNRIKEAYAFKISNQHWDSIVSYIQNSGEMSRSVRNYHTNLEKVNSKEVYHYIPVFSKVKFMCETGQSNQDFVESFNYEMNNSREAVVDTSLIKPGD